MEKTKKVQKKREGRPPPEWFWRFLDLAPEKEYLTVRDIADLLGISTGAIATTFFRHEIKSEEIPKRSESGKLCVVFGTKYLRQELKKRLDDYDGSGHRPQKG